jgi:hypothetical protein
MIKKPTKPTSQLNRRKKIVRFVNSSLIMNCTFSCQIKTNNNISRTLIDQTKLKQFYHPKKQLQKVFKLRNI